MPGRLLRRAAIAGIVICALVFDGAAQAQQPAPKKRLNVLLLVADDLNWDTPGCFGGAAPEITPQIDRLAAEGMRFTHAYVNIAVCTPSRSVLLSGLYPQNNGVEGFQRIRPGTPTLPALLGAAGYLCGNIGKPLGQQELFRWSASYIWPGAGDENRWGRDPAVYRRFAASFFKMARTANQPFLLMMSSHDPHRPFGGGPSDRPHFEQAEPSRRFAPKDVRVPGFLPDLPALRREFAAYCDSTRRLDDMVGAVLDELSKAGYADDTIVIFLSDHGIAMPYAKSNCYVASARTPLIVRWPARVAKGAVESAHMVSTVDLLPTLLDALTVEKPDRLDGRSFLPLLRGEPQDGRDAVFAQFNHIHGRKPYPMRSVITKKSVYVFNAWSNGSRRYRAEPMAGAAFAAMKRAGGKDAKLAARVRHFERRTVEEYYDLTNDPHGLTNLIGKGGVVAAADRENLNRQRKALRNWMVKYKDPALRGFDGRDSPEALEQFMREYTDRARKEINALKAYEKKHGYYF